ncbi:REP-associated tyrosine transposase [Salipiger abyssi]|uniref:REP-associated tyrosine transposase n=1 Tax=Salipiger abyssi TaxID=1250539 RepID=UPI00405855CA
MPNYRRLQMPGASYFFTVALARRPSALLLEHVDDLRGAYLDTIREAPVFCDAMVILPDHLHAVWTLPPGDNAFPERWRKIKARFSRRVGAGSAGTGAVGRIAHPTRVSSSKRAKRERGIWQRRYWEHMIRDEADYQAHVAYCWGNPVRHGLAARPSDWPWSSIHRDIRLGRVDANWSGGLGEGMFGE